MSGLVAKFIAATELVVSRRAQTTRHRLVMIEIKETLNQARKRRSHPDFSCSATDRFACARNGG
jgi:hypothetical protein